MKKKKKTKRNQKLKNSEYLIPSKKKKPLKYWHIKNLKKKKPKKNHSQNLQKKKKFSKIKLDPISLSIFFLLLLLLITSLFASFLNINFKKTDFKISIENFKKIKINLKIPCTLIFKESENDEEFLEGEHFFSEKIENNILILDNIKKLNNLKCFLNIFLSSKKKKNQKNKIFEIKSYSESQIYSINKNFLICDFDFYLEKTTLNLKNFSGENFFLETINSNIHLENFDYIKSKNYLISTNFLLISIKDLIIANNIINTYFNFVNKNTYELKNYKNPDDKINNFLNKKNSKFLIQNSKIFFSNLKKKKISSIKNYITINAINCQLVITTTLIYNNPNYLIKNNQIDNLKKYLSQNKLEAIHNHIPEDHHNILYKVKLFLTSANKILKNFNFLYNNLNSCLLNPDELLQIGRNYGFLTTNLNELIFELNEIDRGEFSRNLEKRDWKCQNINLYVFNRFNSFVIGLYFGAYLYKLTNLKGDMYFFFRIDNLDLIMNSHPVYKEIITYEKRDDNIFWQAKILDDFKIEIEPFFFYHAKEYIDRFIIIFFVVVIFFIIYFVLFLNLCKNLEKKIFKRNLKIREKRDNEKIKSLKNLSNQFGKLNFIYYLFFPDYNNVLNEIITQIIKPYFNTTKYFYRNLFKKIKNDTDKIFISKNYLTKIDIKELKFIYANYCYIYNLKIENLEKNENLNFIKENKFQISTIDENKEFFIKGIYITEKDNKLFYYKNSLDFFIISKIKKTFENNLLKLSFFLEKYHDFCIKENLKIENIKLFEFEKKYNFCLISKPKKFIYKIFTKKKNDNKKIYINKNFVDWLKSINFLVEKKFYNKFFPKNLFIEFLYIGFITIFIEAVFFDFFVFLGGNLKILHNKYNFLTITLENLKNQIFFFSDLQNYFFYFFGIIIFLNYLRRIFFPKNFYFFSKNFFDIIFSFLIWNYIHFMIFIKFLKFGFNLDEFLKSNLSINLKLIIRFILMLSIFVINLTIFLSFFLNLFLKKKILNFLKKKIKKKIIKSFYPKEKIIQYNNNTINFQKNFNIFFYEKLKQQKKFNDFKALFEKFAEKLDIDFKEDITLLLFLFMKNSEKKKNFFFNYINLFFKEINLIRLLNIFFLVEKSKFGEILVDFFGFKKIYDKILKIKKIEKKNTEKKKSGNFYKKIENLNEILYRLKIYDFLYNLKFNGPFFLKSTENIFKIENLIKKIFLLKKKNSDFEKIILFVIKYIINKKNFIFLFSEKDFQNLKNCLKIKLEIKTIKNLFLLKHFTNFNLDIEFKKKYILEKNNFSDLKIFLIFTEFLNEKNFYIYLESINKQIFEKNKFYKNLLNFFFMDSNQFKGLLGFFFNSPNIYSFKFIEYICFLNNFNELTDFCQFLLNLGILKKFKEISFLKKFFEDEIITIARYLICEEKIFFGKIKKNKIIFEIQNFIEKKDFNDLISSFEKKNFETFLIVKNKYFLKLDEKNDVNYKKMYIFFMKVKIIFHFSSKKIDAEKLFEEVISTIMPNLVKIKKDFLKSIFYFFFHKKFKSDKISKNFSYTTIANYSKILKIKKKFLKNFFENLLSPNIKNRILFIEENMVEKKIGKFLKKKKNQKNLKKFTKTLINFFLTKRVFNYNLLNFIKNENRIILKIFMIRCIKKKKNISF